MRWKQLERRKRFTIIGVLVLAVGLGISVLVYATAREDEDAVGYDVAGERSYAVSPLSSKKYVHDLERFGGKSAVLADAFNRWFDGLWHGESLAYTIAFFTALTAGGFFLAARSAGADAHAEPADRTG